MNEIMLNLNTNYKVEVTLTEIGKKAWEQYHSKPNVRVHLPANNMVSMHLWELMHIFGPLMDNGRPIPFEKNEIRFKFQITVQ